MKQDRDKLAKEFNRNWGEWQTGVMAKDAERQTELLN